MKKIKVMVLVLIVGTVSFFRVSAESLPLLSGEDIPTKAEQVGVLPKEKEQIIKKFLLASKERNPFAKRTKKDQKGPGIDSQSEEAKIRAALGQFSVSGIAKGSNGYKVQLGGVILSLGEILPKLIPGQTDDLQVSKITSSLVEITWVGDEEADKPRRLTVAVDLEPKVGVFLPTASKNKSAGSDQLVYLNKESSKSE